MSFAQTIPQMLQETVKRTPHAVAYRKLNEAGVWRPVSWKEHECAVARLSKALARLGLCVGDRIGIICRSTHEWELMQMATLAAGGVVAGIDVRESPQRLEEIIRQIGLTGLAVENSAIVDELPFETRKRLRFKICMQRKAVQPRQSNSPIVSMSKLLETEISPGDLVSHAARDQPAVIIFTSGTTGTPKSIAYTHGQVCLACEVILEAFSDITEGAHLVCWMPLANLFQRIINFCAIARGACTFFVENPMEVVKHLSTINPHIIVGVPRFYEKLHAGIMNTVERSSPVSKFAVRSAIKIGESYVNSAQPNKAPPFLNRLIYRLSDRVVLGRLRQFMGSNLSYAISGSAPMPEWLLWRFQAMGILILEAYGLSENIIPIAANRKTSYKFGTVGRPLRGVEIKLADDGELLIRGPGVFAGYWDAGSTQSSFDPSGYLCSGDYGEVDNEGFIRLTGRKSDVFKTSTGRRITPALIEGQMRSVAYIEHVAVLGAGRKTPVAVVSLLRSALVERLGNSHIVSRGDDSAFLADACDVIRTDLTGALDSLPGYQRPAGIVLTTHSFEPRTGELTMNLKLRRGHIESKFSGAIEALYSILAREGEKRTTLQYASDTVLCRL